MCTCIVSINQPLSEIFAPYEFTVMTINGDHPGDI